MSLPRDVARLRRDQSTRARRSPRAGVPLPVRIGDDSAQGTTDVNGEVTLTVPAPRGRVVGVSIIAPTHTAGVMTVPGAQNVPGSPLGASAQVVLPRTGATLDITVYLYNAVGSPVAGRTVGAFTFAF